MVENSEKQKFCKTALERQFENTCLLSPGNLTITIDELNVTNYWRLIEGAGVLGIARSRVNYRTTNFTTTGIWDIHSNYE